MTAWRAIEYPGSDLTAPAVFTLEHSSLPGAPPPGARRRVTWVYDLTDPLAVCLRFNSDVEWPFARSLLADVFEVDYTGQGDVTLGVFGDDLVVSLSSPSGHATITGDARVAFEFLMDTYAVCPPCEGVGHPGHRWCGECAAMGVIVDGTLGRIEREATW